MYGQKGWGTDLCNVQAAVINSMSPRSLKNGVSNDPAVIAVLVVVVVVLVVMVVLVCGVVMIVVVVVVVFVVVLEV